MIRSFVFGGCRIIYFFCYYSYLKFKDIILIRIDMFEKIVLKKNIKKVKIVFNFFIDF